MGIMTPHCWDLMSSGWMIVWLSIRVGSNGWSPLKWLGSTWKQQLTEVLSWPNTAQRVFIKVSALALSVNNTDWIKIFFFLYPLYLPLSLFLFSFKPMLSFLKLQMCFPPAWQYLWPTSLQNVTTTKLNNQDQVLSSLPIIHESNSNLAST